MTPGHGRLVSPNRREPGAETLSSSSELIPAASHVFHLKPNGREIFPLRTRRAGGSWDEGCTVDCSATAKRNAGEGVGRVCEPASLPRPDGHLSSQRSAESQPACSTICMAAENRFPTLGTVCFGMTLESYHRISSYQPRCPFRALLPAHLRAWWPQPWIPVVLPVVYHTIMVS